MKKISVLLATRSRTKMLGDSIDSLMTNVSDSENVEIMLGIDNDDQETLDFVQSEDFQNKMQDEYNVDVQAVLFDRLGYKNLHQYMNQLWGQANGEWLLLWNDDAIMQTKDWDLEIGKYDDQFALLKMNQTNHTHPYALFPIIPTDWCRLIGSYSGNPQNDAWLNLIAKPLGIIKDIPVDVLHDRFDLTGNNDDDIFRSREYAEGNPQDPGDLMHENNIRMRDAITHKIAWFCNRIGQTETSDYFDKVKAGEIDPFADWKKVREESVGLGSGI
jgi:hypothetical protein